MKLYYVLSIVSIIVFIIFIFFNKNNKKIYVLFVLYLLPVMDMPITPVQWGGLRVFDGISYIILFVFFKHLIFIKRKDAYNIYYFLFFLFVTTILLGSLNSRFITNSLTSIPLIFPVFIYTKTLITECDIDMDFQKKVIQSLKLVGLISIVFLIIQIIVGLKFSLYPELNRNTTSYGGIRYTSFFHDPQKYGQYLVLLSFLFLINYKDITKPRWENYVFFVLTIVALLSTGGRSALIAILVGMFMLFFILGFQYRVILISLSVVGIFAFLFFSDSLLIFNRAKALDGDYVFRTSLWNEADQFHQNKPVLGIGLGNYQKYAKSFSPNYYITPEREVIFFDQPESGYWMIFTELGMVGSFIVSLFILIPLFKSIQIYFKANKDLTIFLIIAALVAWMITFISVYSLNDRRILIVVATLISILIGKSKDSRTLYEI